MMMNTPRKYAFRGFLAGVLILVIGEICVAIFIGFHFDGKCGGLMPFLSGPRDCTLIEYVISFTLFTTVLILGYYWYYILIFLFLATLGGYAFGRIKVPKKHGVKT